MVNEKITLVCGRQSWVAYLSEHKCERKLIIEY